MISTKSPEKVLKFEAIPYKNLYVLYIKNYNRYVSKSDESVEFSEAAFFDSPESANKFLIKTHRDTKHTIILKLDIVQTAVSDNYFINLKIKNLLAEVEHLKTLLK